MSGRGNVAAAGDVQGKLRALAKTKAINALAEVQEKLGWSEDQLAERMGVELGELQAWKDGQGRPLMEHVNAMQEDVLAFNDARRSSLGELVDLRPLRAAISDLDRSAGTHPTSVAGRGR